MSDVTSVASVTVEQSAIEDNAPAYTSTHHHGDVALIAHGGANPTLGQRQSLGVVVDGQRQLQVLRQPLMQRESPPRRNVNRRNMGAPERHWAATTDTQPKVVIERCELCQELSHRGKKLLAIGWPGIGNSTATKNAALRGNLSRSDLGAPYIQRQYTALQRSDLRCHGSQVTLSATLGGLELTAKERMTTTSSSDTETDDRPGAGSGSGGLGPSAISQFVTAFDAIAHNMETVVRGKPVVVRQALLCLLAQGHLLVEDVPGVGKTTVAKALAQSIDAEWGRIQFTADLLPADVTGLSIWKRDSATFEFRKGPIFNNIVLADEINRSSPKTQSALLEAMAEEQVTVDGQTYQLPEPFMVVATQNPVESEGTYPLPESQLDRFLMRISVGYPRRTDELSILQTHEQRHLVDALTPVATAEDLITMINMVKKVTIAPELRGYLVDLAEATRSHPSLELGMSPRATLSLQQVSRAHALASQRAYVIDDDIKAVASSVISHRLMLRPEAELQGTDTDRVVADILDSVPVPYDRM